jgi:hypothetical protein
MKEMFKMLFPEWREWINKIWKEISKKISFDMDSHECAWLYIELKTVAHLNYHTMGSDVTKNLHYICNYIWKRSSIPLDLPSCRNFIESAMSCDVMLFSIMSGYWFFNIYDSVSYIMYSISLDGW